MKNIPINNNPFGVVMAYVLKNGEDDLINLFDKYNIPADPTPQNIIAAIKQHGIKFLHEFDVTIIRPYSARMIAEMSNAIGDRIRAKRVANAANVDPTIQDAAVNLTTKKDPNKLNNILAGLGGAFDVFGTVLDTVQTIKGNNNPQPQPQVIYANPSPTISTAKTEDEKAEKNKKIMLWVGGGLIVAVVALFAFMQLKKK